MVRSVIGWCLGLSLALTLSTIVLAVVWGGPTPTGPLSLALLIAFVCVLFGGFMAGLIGERRPLLSGGLVGLAMGGLVGMWPGSFPLKLLFFRVAVWRAAGVPILATAGILGGWLAGKLIAPGGLLAGDP